MACTESPNFLSRPRRFGKSLLVSTLTALFEGRRELFEEMVLDDGTIQPRLFIASTPWKWETHPVLRFDFSAGDLQTNGQLDALVNSTLSDYEQLYGITPDAPDANIRFKNLVIEARRKTGRKVVVLCDEYDNMMLHSLDDPEKQALHSRQNRGNPLSRNVLRPVFQQLQGPTTCTLPKWLPHHVPYLLSNDNERHFHALLYTLLVSFGADVVAEDMSAQGRVDLVLRMPSTIYIIEIKYDKPADEALLQIQEKKYAAKYAFDGRPIVGVGLSFSSQERNISEWRFCHL